MRAFNLSTRLKFARYLFSNNLLYKLSTHIAPNGAVIKIDNTATVNTIFPHSNPIDNGIAPIAACTVAFGVYATIQNNLSLFDKPVLSNDTATPVILNNNAPKMSNTADTPADAIKAVELGA